MLFLLGVLLAAPYAYGHLQTPLQEPLAEPQLSERGNPLTSEFEKYVNELLERFHVPSLTIAVVDDEGIYSAVCSTLVVQRLLLIYSANPACYQHEANHVMQAYGTAVFPDIPATPETLYYTGSTTKSFTAAALTLLVDSTANSSRPLRLSDPLYKHLPGFRLASDYATLHITIEDALSHRSGLPRHDQTYEGSNYTSDDLINALPYLPLTAEPRTTFQYCNIMYMLVSRVIENVAGIALGDFLKKQLWEPFGMTSTYFSLSDAQAAEKKEGKQLARGYYWDQDSQKYIEEPWMDSVIVSGAGNMISNVIDYAQYLSAMLNDKPPISEDGYRELRTARTIAEPWGAPPLRPGISSYTLGWEQQMYRDQEIFTHGGGLFGFGAFMAYIPGKKWAIAMMGNTEQRSNFIQVALAYRLADDLLGIPKEDREDLTDLFQLQLQQLTINYLNSTRRLYPDAARPPIPLSRPLEAYTGEYWHPAFRNITLSIGSARYPHFDDGYVASKAARLLSAVGRKERVLQTTTLNKVWQADVQLEHVSGEHFVLWTMPLPDRPSQIAKSALKAEFRVAPNGTVMAIGLAAGELMNEEKIWYQRVA
jgi:CubicO group peptidase (beta-lactamase class C family)